MSPYNSFVCGPKFTKFLLSNVEGAVVDQILFRFAIIWAVYGIFAIKVEGCKKSRGILAVFSPSQIFGGRPSKTYTDFITPDSRHIIWKKFYEDTPTSPQVIGAHTLNFKVNFKFSGLNFFCLWTIVHGIFSMGRGRNRYRSHFFSILDIWSRFGDIRDQSRKL